MMPNASVDVTIRGSMPAPFGHATTMRRTAAVASLAALLAFTVGCKQKLAETPVEAAAAPAPATAASTPTSTPAPSAKLPPFASPERITQIKAGGRTGFWASTTEFCPGKHERSTILTWNVTDSGASKVVVFVVNKAGKEQHFGRGGPIGERQTGPWLKPGVTFRLRNADGGAELGSIQIARGNDC